jgi:hypothetical protein
MTKIRKRDFKPKLRNPVARALNIDRDYQQRIVKIKREEPKPITVKEATRLLKEENEE